jgi:peroxiredoxin Q/BCP
MTLMPQDKAPDFTMPTDGNNSVSLSDYKGQPLILYFYPKDDTPGCTKQACSFTEKLPAFEKLNCAVLGVSKDSVAKHEKFKAKRGLQFPLASDENTDVCERYGVWMEKSMYGKAYMGIERTTFLIDGNGIIQNVWNKVKVDGHIDEVLAALKNLQQKAA